MIFLLTNYRKGSWATNPRAFIKIESTRFGYLFSQHRHHVLLRPGKPSDDEGWRHLLQVSLRLHGRNAGYIALIKRYHIGGHQLTLYDNIQRDFP